MTSVWPIAVIARMAANGSIPSSDEWLTLCGSTIQLIRKSRPVPTQMAIDALPSRAVLRPRPGMATRVFRADSSFGAATRVEFSGAAFCSLEDMRISTPPRVKSRDHPPR